AAAAKSPLFQRDAGTGTGYGTGTGIGTGTGRTFLSRSTSPTKTTIPNISILNIINRMTRSITAQRRWQRRQAIAFKIIPVTVLEALTVTAGVPRCSRWDPASQVR
ncbi:GSCOCG00007338001-RA-CDS, partial [Cotesia congregata]